VGFTFCQKKKREKIKNTGFMTCSEREKRKGNCTLLGCLKDDRQTFFKYFRMSFSKFENPKQLLHRDNEKKNTQCRRNIRTEERLALT